MTTEALGKLKIDGPWFRDEAGRQVLLRGVNLGGDCKLPCPDGATYLPTDFSNHRTVSFVGRPAPLDEIDGHLARLAGWGFNCLRLLTTWEAVEHDGPGIHDEAYLDYYAEVCRRAGDHGFYLFVDFHQDVWSRMTGGSGAPGWTFEAAGLDFTAFDRADASLVMQNRYDPAIGGLQDSYPVMSWSSNYAMPPNGIMWTLFLAGERFAPALTVDGQNIQHFLQDHYLGAMRAVAERVADFPHVLGFDTLNEPGLGYIGRPLSESAWRYRGYSWSTLDGLAVAAGIPRDLPRLQLGGKPGGDGFRANAARQSLWLPGRSDPFRDAGVWDFDADGNPRALVEDFFQRHDGEAIEVERHGLLPLFHQVAETVRAIRDDWLLFAEINPFRAGTGVGFPDAMPERTVNANHWYDLTSLVTKRFDPAGQQDILTGEWREGRAAIERNYVDGLSRLKEKGDALNGGAPSLVGEFGIQYDMNDGEAYERWVAGEHGDEIWHAQEAALDAMYNAIDELLISSTQWNYTVSNSNDVMIGDGWNQEDLSIWSTDQAVIGERFSGARALRGFCRPFARRIQGTPLRQRFRLHERRFELEFDGDPRIAAPTEIFVPRHIFGCDPEVICDPSIMIVRADQSIGLTVREPGRQCLAIIASGNPRECC